MPSFTPTPEQSAIVLAATSTRDNLLISALAGAAKTSTLVMIAEALPGVPTLSLAFNRRIAEEMTKRLPSHVQCATLNSIGHRVWSAAIGRRLTVNTKKTFDLIKETVDGLKGSDRANARESFSEILNGVRLAKQVGYIPDRAFESTPRLVGGDGFYAGFDEEPDAVARDIIDSVVVEGIKLSYAGAIDYDDQIYMPTMFGGTFPKFPLVLVDEAQDLSALNHQMLQKLVTSRIIAVGDSCQSIYGFRGAAAQGMTKLREAFSMTELRLSVSFRCPRAIVRRAQSRAPHMQWAEWAAEGRVEALDHWRPSDVPDGAAIICRNNAPLFKCALHFLRAGRGVSLVGTDLGPQLIKTMKKLGPEAMTRDQTFEAIDRWEEEHMKKAKGKAVVADKAECLRVFAAFGDSLKGAIAYAEHLFEAKGPIQLMSGHKSKGLEFQSVYHLDPWRIPSKYAESAEDLEQERNLDYVITTRAKQDLFLVNMEDLGE